MEEQVRGWQVAATKTNNMKAKQKQQWQSCLQLIPATSHFRIDFRCEKSTRSLHALCFCLDRPALHIDHCDVMGPTDQATIYRLISWWWPPFIVNELRDRRVIVEQRKPFIGDSKQSERRQCLRFDCFVKRRAMTGTGQIATSLRACLMTNLPLTQLSKRNAKPMLTSPSTSANVVYVF